MAEEEAAAAAPVAPEALAPVEKPDRAKFDLLVASLNAEIAEHQKLRDAVQQRFVATRTSNDELNARITEARSRFQVIKLEHGRLKDERSALLGEREAARSTADKLTEELKELRGKFKFGSVEDIDRRLASLQLRQATESMPLKEERDLIREIEALRAQRGQYGRVAELVSRSDDAWSAAREAGKGTSERIGALSEALKPISVKLNEAYEVLQTYQKERDEARSIIPALMKEREEHNTAVTERMAALRAAKNAYYSAERAYNAWLVEEKRRQAAAAAKEREEKAAARAAEREARAAAASAAGGAAGVAAGAADADAPASTAAAGGGAAAAAEPPAPPVHPWAAQMTECDLLLAYLARLKPKAVAPPPAPAHAGAAAGAVAPAQLVGLKGEGLKARGGDDDDLAFLRSGPGATAGGKKSVKKAQRAAAAAEAAASGDGDAATTKAAPLSFQLDALSSFGLLGVTPPATTAELDAAIAAVAAKKQWYETAPPPAPKPVPAASSGGAAVAGGGAAGRGAGRGIGRGGGRSGGGAGSSAAAPATAAPAASFAVGATVSTPYGPGVVKVASRPGGGLVVDMTAFGAVGYLQADQVRLLQA